MWENSNWSEASFIADVIKNIFAFFPCISYWITAMQFHTPLNRLYFRARMKNHIPWKYKGSNTRICPEVFFKSNNGLPASFALPLLLVLISAHYGCVCRLLAYMQDKIHLDLLDTAPLLMSVWSDIAKRHWRGSGHPPPVVYN